MEGYCASRAEVAPERNNIYCGLLRVIAPHGPESRRSLAATLLSRLPAGSADAAAREGGAEERQRRHASRGGALAAAAAKFSKGRDGGGRHSATWPGAVRVRH